MYKIAKQYSTYISLTQVEESAGLSPVTYKLNLGSRHTHGKFRKEKPTHAEATQTETFENIRQSRWNKTNMVEHRSKRTFKNIHQSHMECDQYGEKHQSERHRKRQKDPSDIRRHPSTTANVTNMVKHVDKIIHTKVIH